MLLPVHNEETELFDGDLIIAGNTVLGWMLPLKSPMILPLRHKMFRTAVKVILLRRTQKTSKFPMISNSIAQIKLPLPFLRPDQTITQLLYRNSAFHNTDVKCITCEDFISVEITLSDYKHTVFSIYM